MVNNSMTAGLKGFWLFAGTFIMEFISVVTTNIIQLQVATSRIKAKASLSGRFEASMDDQQKCAYMSETRIFISKTPRKDSHLILAGRCYERNTVTDNGSMKRPEWDNEGIRCDI
jgi:hypothetical protein